MDGEKRNVDRRFAVTDENAIHQIMLKYRPIAPRPSSLSIMSVVTSKRTKRKYVRVKKKDPTNTKCYFNNNNNNNTFITSNVITPSPDLHDVDLSTAVRGGNKVMVSWITTESFTRACEVERWLGYTDDEIRKNLEIDSCPGFISNCYDEVIWVNLAYRRIGDPHPEGGAPPPDVVVWLTTKLGFVKYWPSFSISCRVTVAYELLEKKSHMTVPCDVWRMDCGGFAWRLDVGAALSLGRISLS